MGPAVVKLGTSFRTNAWWTIPPMALALLLGVTFGLWGLWLSYAGLNLVGVWLYSDHHGSRMPRRQLWMKRLAIPLLPVGVVGVLATGGGPSPSDSVTGASSDEAVRKETATATSASSSLHRT